MENGRAGLTEEEKTIMESRRTSADGKEDMFKGDDTVKEETPPDGTETLMEWKEGSDMIVEQRTGPGEEVGVGCVSNDVRADGLMQG